MHKMIIRQFWVVMALVAVAVILWIDIATGLWQDYVILAGLAAGLVTFVLTVLVVDRVIARSTHRRWAPVTRLALTDLLHALAVDDADAIAHGRILPRCIDQIGEPGEDEVGEDEPGVDASPDRRQQDLVALRHTVVAERERLTRVLTGWAAFLAATADATEVLDHTAEISERLDIVRDASLTAEATGASDAASLARLNVEIARYNTAVAALVTELTALIKDTDRILREEAMNAPE